MADRVRCSYWGPPTATAPLGTLCAAEVVAETRGLAEAAGQAAGWGLTPDRCPAHRSDPSDPLSHLVGGGHG